MKLTVYKYFLGRYTKMSNPDKSKLTSHIDVITGTHSIVKVLDFDIDSNLDLWVWALVKDYGDGHREKHRFMVVPSGFIVNDLRDAHTPSALTEHNLTYIASHKQQDFNYVWHLFEVKS